MRWMGKKGMIVCFLEREFGNPEDYLESRALEEYLLEAELNYEKIESYHPDYEDYRVKMYRIWK